MPLEVSRLLDSDLVALSTGDEFKAAFLIWAKSWAQIPAASIPDDDRILAKWTGYSLTEWANLREMALRGWVKCSDGRLYHPVIADLAVTAHAKRVGQAEKANSRWARARAEKAAEAAAMPINRDGEASVMPRHEETDAAAMQVKGTVEGTEDPPVIPPKGGKTPPSNNVEKLDDVRLAFEQWNALARRCGLPVARSLDMARRRLIARRVADVGLDGWGEALKNLERSAFLRGLRADAEGRAFRADLAFVCQAKTFPRLLEGFYGDDSGELGIRGPPPQAVQDTDFAERQLARLKASDAARSAQS